MGKRFAWTPNEFSCYQGVTCFCGLACDCAQVTSRGSNWDRLIDELRCVWVAKCAYPFVEIGEEETNW